MIEKRYLSSKEAAEYCGFASGTFNNYRCRKIGCPYIKRNGKVLYEREAIDHWVQSGRIQTSYSNEVAK